MPLWQIALIVFVGAWIVQGIGTYLQMRHYSRMMGQVSRNWSDGFVGAGNARSTFGRGVIALLVVSPDRIVRRLMVMQGRSVFARFSPVPDVEGQPLDVLDAPAVRARRTKAEEKALSIARQQIETAAARKVAA